MGCFSTKVNVPGPSAQETALQQEQLNILKKQSAETEAFKPYLYSLMGLKDVGGALQKMPWEEQLASMNPQEKAGYELANLYFEQQKKSYGRRTPCFTRY